MKKIIDLLSLTLILFTLFGCGATFKNLKMSDFQQAFKASGVNVSTNLKPDYALIGAKDGIMFYMNNSPVKIYEFASKDALNTAEKNHSKIMSGWPINGLFVLETNEAKAKEIFNGVK